MSDETAPARWGYKFSRFEVMPSADTFSMAPIKNLLNKYISPSDVVIDPFAKDSKVGTITNDMNPTTTAQYHMNAPDFLDELLKQNVVADVVLFDPPYSPRQITECYATAGLRATMVDTQNARLYREVKKRLWQLLKPRGYAICFGWNSSGMGFKKAWQPLEIMLVHHFGAHNDTIVTVQRKMQRTLDESEG
jgi:hypothetical protein